MISEERLAKLWREHANAIALLCRTHGAVAEDCVQEAFIRLASQIPVPDDPFAWLVRVARNLAISRSRSEKVRSKHERMRAEENAAWFHPLEQHQPGEFSGDEIQSALEHLPVAVREVVVAHLWGNMTFRQIADSFQMSRSSAHRLYLSGLRQLEDELLGRITESQANLSN